MKKIFPIPSKNQNSHPRVSVIIPAFNEENFILQFLDFCSKNMTDFKDYPLILMLTAYDL